MGMIICEEHGGTGIITGILEEICQKVLNDERISQDELSYILIDCFDKNDFLFANKYIVTKNFKISQNLDDYYRITTEEEEERLSKKIGANIGVLCGKCFSEYLDKYNLIIDSE